MYDFQNIEHSPFFKENFWLLKEDNSSVTKKFLPFKKGILILMEVNFHHLKVSSRGDHSFISGQIKGLPLNKDILSFVPLLFHPLF